MTEHISQSDINRLAVNALGAIEWARVRRHLLECDCCLHRMLDKDVTLPTTNLAGRQAGRAAAQSPEPIRAFVY